MIIQTVQVGELEEGTVIENDNLVKCFAEFIQFYSGLQICAVF